MEDSRQLFDLRRNDDFIFAKTPWWMSNHVLTTAGAIITVVVGVGVILAFYAFIILGMVHAAQAWMGQ